MLACYHVPMELLLLNFNFNRRQKGARGTSSDAKIMCKKIVSTSQLHLFNGGINNEPLDR